jgi:O-antigen ligase
MVVVTGAILTLLVGAGAVVIAPRVSPTSPVGRVMQSVLTEADVGAAAYELFWFRDGYGAAAVELIKEHPLVGVGVGRFAGVSSVYAQRITGRPIPPDNAQNLWRQTLVEQGLLGLLPILWLTGLTVMSLCRGYVDGVNLVLRFMLAGLGVALLVGYPVQDPAIAVTLALLVTAVARAGSGST